MTMLARIARMSICTGVILTLAIATVGHGATAEEARIDRQNVDFVAHWAARATLANAVMFSGLGEPLSMSMDTRDAILKRAGYIARPAMPDMAMIGAVYAGGDPDLGEPPDFSRPNSLRWKPQSFDRTIDPAAQAWTLIKITSPGFHLNFHDSKHDKRIALVMLPQAEVQADVLASRLLTARGLFASDSADGVSSEPRPRDQAVALWAVSNLILAATSEHNNYWHKAWRELVDADDYRDLAHRSLDAVSALPPQSAVDRAFAIEALGRYALATGEAARRARALKLARVHADALRQMQGQAIEDIAIAVYGLVEAGRLLDDNGYGEAAVTLFREALLPAWDDQLGVFRTGEPIRYTSFIAATVAAALNAMRWYGPHDLSEQADALYPRFLDTVLIEAGLMQSSPAPLIPAAYRGGGSGDVFERVSLPSPATAGRAPVFAGEVQFNQGAWRVTDRSFRTADAMFLANMLVMPHEGQADAFLPADRLSTLSREVKP